MFLMTFDRVGNVEIFNRILTHIVKHKLYNLVEIVVKPDLEKKTHKLKGIVYSQMIVSAKELLAFDWFDVEQLFYDFIENGDRVVIDTTGVTPEEMTTINELIEELGIKCKVGVDYDFSQEINLSCVDDIVYNSILEIFDRPGQVSNYSMDNFIIQWNIDKKGMVTDNDGKEYGNILEMDLVDFFFKKTSDFKKLRKIAGLKSEDGLFTSEIADFLPFLNPSKNINLDIVNYKEKIFNAIKNIEPKEYVNLDTRLVEVLNANEYIQLKDIVEIINKEDVLGKQSAPLFVVM